MSSSDNSSCANAILTPPASFLKTHLYTIGDEKVSYEFPSFSASAGCTNIDYQSSVAIATGSSASPPDLNFIELGDSRIVKWSTPLNLSYIGDYRVTLQASAGCSTEQVSYTVKVEKGCAIIQSLSPSTIPEEEEYTISMTKKIVTVTAF